MDLLDVAQLFDVLLQLANVLLKLCLYVKTVSLILIVLLQLVLHFADDSSQVHLRRGTNSYTWLFEE